MVEAEVRTLELDGNTVEIFESGTSVVLQILCPSFECVPGQRIRIVGKKNLLELRDAIDSFLTRKTRVCNGIKL